MDRWTEGPNGPPVIRSSGVSPGDGRGGATTLPPVSAAGPESVSA